MKIVRNIAASVAGVAVLALASPPAMAAPPNGYLHMYEKDYYGGGTMGRASYDKNFANDIMCKGETYGNWLQGDSYATCNGIRETDSWFVDDSISSINNRTPYWWKMFEDRDYRGYTLCIRPWGYDNNLGNNTPVEDDISSVQRTSSTSTQPGGCDKVAG